ncbi:O-methyltransferase [Flexithrix dorotheae]|uniref:O-methyltransferase n=1 Tax=Flexithrix dorotheae TaxID=70993 RepID=UPI00037A0C44|nr:O-methyltransferase [Flexithrix dorotheae]
MKKKKNIEITDAGVSQYIDQHTTKEAELLSGLIRETHLNTLAPQMASGNTQGVLLTMFVQMMQAEKVLEIGTFTGYSAICLARGLKKGGMLYTIEVNEELEEMAKRYIKKAGLGDRVKQIIGNALEIIPDIKEQFDLVFIDAEKRNYSNYFDLVAEKVRVGGVILADNVLWSGKVAYKEGYNDKDTEAIRVFNNQVLEDERFSTTILPVRDGILVAQKLKS